MGRQKVTIVNSCHRYSNSSIVNPKAFTLIELLVVIAIIVLLMAILVQVLRSARNQTRAVLCRANLKQWGMSLNLYTEDHEGYLPADMVGRESIWLIRGWSVTDDRLDEPRILNPIEMEKLACCPMAVKPGSKEFNSVSSRHSASGSVSVHVVGTVGSTFEAWEITIPSPAFRGSYGFNRGMDDLVPKFPLKKINPDISSVKGRANIPVLLDCPEWDGAFRDNGRPPRYSGFNGMGLPFCINRHNGYINGLFLDWSVRKIGLKELWTLKWYHDFDTANPWTRAGGVQPEEWPEWMRGFKDY